MNVQMYYLKNNRNIKRKRGEGDLGHRWKED